MTSSTRTRFSWIGQFSAYVPGNKSPYQYLALQLVAADGKPLAPAERQQVSLSKALRRMLIGYLAPQDWISVVGKTKVSAQTGELQWKASEIVKLSPQQVQLYASWAVSATTETYPQQKPQPIRALICQKSSCRQRGSQAVEAAIAHTLQSHDSSIQLKIQPTGCMKQCKAGPHLVLIPPKSPASSQISTASRTTPQLIKTQRYAHVTPQTAQQIVEQLL